MLVPYFDNSTSSKDDIMNSITDIEREKMKEYDCVRDSGLERFYGFTMTNEPSLVLDDFLFLGNMQNARDRELLERFQISKFFFFKNIF
jgi:hypothetical protein